MTEETKDDVIEGKFTEKSPAEPEEESGPDEGTEEEEDGDEEEPHPADVLRDAILDIDKQIKRLGSRRSGDLKFELINNLYPIMAQGFSAIFDYIEMIESEAEEGDLPISAEDAENKGKEILDAIAKLADKDPDSEESKKTREWLSSLKVKE